jgi:hypothetical protein
MSPARTAGLGILTLLGVLDIVGLVGFAMNDAPPAGVMIVGAVLGAITLVGAWMAWHDRHGGVATVIASRVVSALFGIPVFWADDAPGWAKITVAIGIALTVVGVALLASPAARRHPTGRLGPA